LFVFQKLLELSSNLRVTCSFVFQELELPPFLEVARNVTGDPSYSMYTLSKISQAAPISETSS
jgi:hypothetical protein